MRYLLALVAWVGAATLIAPICVIVVLVLAGPHSSVLPARVQPVVLLLGSAVFLVVPLLAARVVWRRTGRRARSARP
jgi:hypothetical protein